MTNFDQVTKQWESVKFPYPYPLNKFLGEEILRNLKETPDRVIQIYHEENLKVTCEDLRLSSIRVAQNLIKLGIKADDVVSVICRYSSSLPSLLAGCVLIGAPINPLDLSFTVNDLKHMFNQTVPKLVVCEGEILERVQQALKELKFNIKIVVMRQEEVEGASNISDLLAPTGTEDDFVPPKFAQKSDKKIMTIMCSSGTTGMPKGVILTHAYWMSFIPFFAATPGKTESRGICFSSVFWNTGLIFQLLLAFNKVDIRIWSRNGFSCQLFSELFEKYKITDVFLAPIHLTAVMTSDYNRIPNIKGFRTLLTGGSICSNWLRKKFSEAFPDANMVVTYGMTEGMLTATTSGAYKENLSVGTLLPNRIAKVVDDNEERLGVGEVGEIRFKSGIKFQGYYNNPEASQNAIDEEGFIKSGDIGYFDENGTLFIIDRKKEIMKCRTFHVNPSEIENIIESINGVQTVSVVGIPDPLATNLPAAAIIKRAGFEHLTEQAVKDFVAERLPEYKHLHGGVFFVDKLPLTPSGKIQKRLVAELIASLAPSQTITEF